MGGGAAGEATRGGGRGACVVEVPVKWYAGPVPAEAVRLGTGRLRDGTPVTAHADGRRVYVARGGSVQEARVLAVDLVWLAAAVMRRLDRAPGGGG